MADRISRHATSSFNVRLIKTVIQFSSVTEFAGLHSNVEEIIRKGIGTNSWHLLCTNIHPRVYRISNYNILG